MKEKYWIIDKDGILPQNKLIANEFLQVLKLANRSEATIDKYRRILESFLGQCSKNLADLVADDVHSWLYTHYGDKKERTYDLILSALASFFKFCQGEELIDRTLVKNDWRPKIPKSLPRYLDAYEQAQIKLCAEQMPLRDRALLSFLLSSGCRCSEAVALNVGDIDLENKTAQVMGKGRKKREVDFFEETALLFKKYLISHPEDKPAFFLNKFGQRLTKSGVYYIIRKIGAKAGLPTKFSPHCCRHTFATNMLARGAKLDLIGELLGHRDLNTVRIYASILPEDIVAEYRRIME